MKSYTLASEQTAAPTGCAYVAPLFWMHWFRWTDSRASGDYQLGARVKDENKFLPTVSGIQSRRLHLICASRGKPAKPKTFWERRSRNET